MSENDGLFLSEKARELYSRFKFSPEKTAVIVGSLFGDASLIMGRKDRIPSFYENHCIEQLEYLKWKSSTLGMPNSVKLRLMTQGYSKGKLVPYFQMRREALLDLEPLFYMRGADGRRKKIVTKEGLELLVGSSLALAVFYMDDGEYGAYSNQSMLHTCGFSLKENEVMADRLQELLHAPVRVKMKRGKYPRLALSEKATNEFIRIVRPFIHPSMAYKIDQDIAHYLDENVASKLEQEYGTKPAKQLAAETGLTVSEIYVVTSRLRLSGRLHYQKPSPIAIEPIRSRYRRFTEENRKYLFWNYGRVPVREIAMRLNTSVSYVKKLVKEMGVAVDNHETEGQGEAGESSSGPAE